MNPKLAGLNSAPFGRMEACRLPVGDAAQRGKVATEEDGRWKLEDGKTDFANAQEICASCENFEPY
jgi:hypothetical protein